MSSVSIASVRSRNEYRTMTESEVLRALAAEGNYRTIYVYANMGSDKVSHTDYQCLREIGDGIPFPGDTQYMFNRILVFHNGEAREYRQFPGKTGEEGLAAAQAAGIAEERIRAAKVTAPERQAQSEGFGATVEAAIEAARSTIPLGAFDIWPPEVVVTGQQGIVEVQAQTEAEAGAQWKASAPSGAKLESLKCETVPKGGVIGMGRKPGTWKAYWSTPFRARVVYRLPPQVTVLYTADLNPPKQVEPWEAFSQYVSLGSDAPDTEVRSGMRFTFVFQDNASMVRFMNNIPGRLDTKLLNSLKSYGPTTLKGVRGNHQVTYEPVTYSLREAKDLMNLAIAWGGEIYEALLS